MKRLALVSVAVGIICLTAFGMAGRRTRIAMHAVRLSKANLAAQTEPLPALDAQGFSGVRKITRPELVKLMTKTRPLSQDENENLDRGCPGLACLYQGLSLRRWPESARGTRAYLRREDALSRRCPAGQDNFIFLKQAWWVNDKPPPPDAATGEVPLASITRTKPGWYTFNYAVYFPSTATYVWINHREYGFPVNVVKPQKAYLSLSPPPLDAGRSAQIYCSTCR